MPQTYCFDFLKNEQMNTKSNFIRKIMRVQLASEPQGPNRPSTPPPSTPRPAAAGAAPPPASAAAIAREAASAARETKEVQKVAAKRAAAEKYEDEVMAGPITLLFEGAAVNVARAIKSLHTHIDGRCTDQTRHAPIKLKRIIKEQFAAEARKRSLQLRLEKLPDGTCRMTCEGALGMALLGTGPL